MQAVAMKVVAHEMPASYRSVEGPVVDDGFKVVGKQVCFVLWKHAAMDILEDTLEQRA